MFDRSSAATLAVTALLVLAAGRGASGAGCDESKVAAAEVVAGDFFGRHVAIHGDHLLIGAFGDDDAGDRSGAAYVFRREGNAWVEEDLLTAGVPTAMAFFGYSTAIWGDYALVGAASEKNGGLVTGAAYLYRRDDNGTPADPGDDFWVQQTKLLAADPGNLDLFGIYVAIEGDYAVVGADDDDTPILNAGSVYVFVRDDNATPTDPSDDTWLQRAKLTASDAEPNDLFGRAVGVSGEWLIVGVYGDDVVGGNSGSVYLFRRDDGGTPLNPGDDTWIEQDKITALDGAAGDQFGVAAGISGDYAVVGAHFADGAGSDSGAAYVFRRNDNGTPADTSDDTWVEQVKLTASDAAASDFFGRFVSISGDWIIVGAYGDDDAGDSSGSAYLFQRDDNGTPGDHSDDTWPERLKLTPGDGAAGDRFGFSVAMSARYALVGALWDDDQGTDSGSAYVFDIRGGVDCDSNGINDSCEEDCNTNGVVDSCDVAGGSSTDCDTNGVPDECESLAAGFDGDGDVDLEDFMRLQSCFDGPGPPVLQNGCCHFDFDEDGDVDLDDFAVFSAALNGPL